MPKTWRILVFAFFLAFWISGCGETSEAPDTPSPEASEESQTTRLFRPGTTEETTAAASMEREPAPVHGYTYGQPSSNRGVDGTGGLPGSNPVDVRLGGVPVWVVGVPLGDGTAWVVSLEDGRVRAFRLEGSGEISPQPIVPERLPPGAPPLVEAKDGELELVVADDRELSALTHPVPASAGGNLLGITRGGGVLAGGERIPGVVALPDARLARSADGAVAALSKPTARYEHGVLGDGLEAEAMTLLRPADEGYRVSGRIRPASGGVFETVAPLWSKLNGDDLLAVTESTAAEGSRVSVYDPDGSLVAAGPFIGAPQKWRHVLAAGPFGPGGETEIAVTRTPHFGPRIEFYEPNLDEGELRLAAARPGYTSHRIYTRNLDAARAGDFDGDGRWELLVPDESYTGLGAIRHEEDGARVAWTLPIGGTARHEPRLRHELGRTRTGGGGEVRRRAQDLTLNAPASRAGALGVRLVCLPTRGEV